MPSLASLTLNGENITAEGIRHLKSAPRLTDLHLTGCPKLGNASLLAVGELTNLSKLTLSGSSMTDAGLAHLNGLVGLESLSLQGPRFTGAGLQPLTGLTKLTSLSLRGAKASNEIFACVHRFPLLKTLNVGAGRPTDSSSITNDGLKLIGQAPNLQIITLSGTAVTDKGLEALVGLPKLLTVFSSWSPGITKMIWDAQAVKRKLATEDRPQIPRPWPSKETIEELRQLGVPIWTDPGDGQIGHVEVQSPKANDATIALLSRLTDIRSLHVAGGKYTAACPRFDRQNDRTRRIDPVYRTELSGRHRATRQAPAPDQAVDSGSAATSPTKIWRHENLHNAQDIGVHE